MKNKHYKPLLNQITTFIFDVDGVLTNGNIIATTKGEMLRTLNVKDGQGIAIAIQKGYRVAIISKGENEGVRHALNSIGVSDIYLNVANKIETLNEFISLKNISKEEILYVGDDLPDIEVMKEVGIAVCPQNAVPEIKNVSNYISHINGGKGCIREIIRQVLKVQGKWNF